MSRGHHWELELRFAPARARKELRPIIARRTARYEHQLESAVEAAYAIADYARQATDSEHTVDAPLTLFARRCEGEKRCELLVLAHVPTRPVNAEVFRGTRAKVVRRFARAF